MRTILIIAFVIVLIGGFGGGLAVYLTSSPETMEPPPPTDGQAEALAPARVDSGLENAIAAYRRGEFETARTLFVQLAAEGDATAQYHLWLIRKDEKIVEAVGWLVKAAEQGNADAANDLGTAYRTGKGLPKRPDLALKWYRRAAEQGHAAAQRNLGEMFAGGLGIVKNEAQARQWWLKAARQGDETALQHLGFDPREVERVRVAAGTGDPDAQVRLADMYVHGHGIERDEGEAARLYRSAAAEGHPEAQARWGRMLEQGRGGVAADPERALALYRQAAEGGSALGQLMLGRRYETGVGVARDVSQALDHYRRAADGGNAEAQYRLGNAYYNGIGVTRDPKAAAKWYWQAAEGRETAAQITLGLLYFWSGMDPGREQPGFTAELRRELGREGREPQPNPAIFAGKVVGVAADPASAFYWFYQAAEQGGAVAAFLVGLSYAKGWGTEVHVAAAAKWLRRAAEQGVRRAQTELAKFYDSADEVRPGIAKDDAEAGRWYQRAAEQGEVEALFRLGRMHAAGRGVDRRPDLAEIYYRRIVALAEAPEETKAGDPYMAALAGYLMRASALDLEELVRDDGRFAESRALLLKLAGLGSSVASYRLAQLYKEGVGVERDVTSRYRWLLIAADPSSDEVPVSGSDESFRSWSDRERTELEPLLSPGQIAEAERAARAWIAEHRGPAAAPAAAD